MAKEESGAGEVAPGLIVRHTSRRLGKLDAPEACERLISGKISFCEFVDQVGEGFRELLDFMTEHDLHPSRPDEVLYCMDFYADLCGRVTLRAQLGSLYRLGRLGATRGQRAAG